MGPQMTAAPLIPGLVPLAVWDVSGAYRQQKWLRWEHHAEALAWAYTHGIGPGHFWRIEFWLADGPCARVGSYKLDENGRRYLDPATCEMAIEERIVMLSELPPKHLRVFP